MPSGMLVGFAGMTHLGINSAVATAARGFSVLGYDADRSLVARLSARDLPVVEPDLDALLAAYAGRVTFTADAEALRYCDIVYIAADVPTDDAARSDLTPIRALIEPVTSHLREDAALVILCQVPPGFTRALTAPPHERLFYQVETLIFGRAVERALHPERFVIGCLDPQIPLPRGYRRLLEAFQCPILPMRYESAELAKIGINFCLVASVSVANTLAEVSEAVGADWAEIVPALRLDKRIGASAYLNPGLGVAGGNLERDLRTVLDIGAARKIAVPVVEAWIANSAHRKEWCWRILRDRLLAQKSRARIAVLGLAYKENTHSTKNSPALALLARLGGQEVRVHDPVVPASAAPSATACSHPLDCAEGADAVVIATPWPEYRALSAGDLASAMAGRLLVDPFRLIDARQAEAAGLEYHALGMPPRGCR
jgi:UDPglucose 6-dehydrogenase